MSGLAKVFLVINLVLTVIFLGTAATLFSVRKDWKTASLKLQEDYEKQFSKQVDDIAKLEEKVKLYVNLASVQHTEIIARQQENKKLKTNLSRTTTDLATAQTKNTEQAALIDTRDSQLSNLSEKVQALATTLQEAEDTRQKAVAQMLVMKNTADTNTLLAAQLTEQVEAQQRELESLRKELEQKKIELELALRKIEGPAVDQIPATIMGVKDNLVVLSVGKDDKVTVGMEFRVFRGDTYLGNVQVRNVYNDMSGAEIIHLVEGAQIREGDNATTRF